MMDNKVIVITVCRNAVQVLEETILSVLNQTYGNLDYIIIDGASTDGTTNIIDRYKDKVKVWLSEPDNGIYDAMNKGLGVAASLLTENETAWVNFMNAGDTFCDEQVLESIFGISGVLNLSPNQNYVRVIGGSTVNVFPDGTIRIDCPELPEFLPIRLTFSHQASFVKYGIETGNNMCVNQWKFDTRYKYAADYKLLLRIYKKYGEQAFVLTNRKVACYSKDGSTTMLHPKKTRYEYLRIQADWKSIRWWKESLKLLIWILLNKKYKEK